VQFCLPLNDIKPSMIEEATKNARAAATKFAKDSESKLGKIQSANQDSSPSPIAMPIRLMSKTSE
jgi:hypothetical protein